MVIGELNVNGLKVVTSQLRSRLELFRPHVIVLEDNLRTRLELEDPLIILLYVPIVLFLAHHSTHEHCASSLTLHCTGRRQQNKTEIVPLDRPGRDNDHDRMKQHS